MVYQDITLSILMHDQAGLLSRVITALARRGHVPSEHRKSQPSKEGQTLLSISFRDKVKLTPKDIQAVRQINNAITEVRIDHPDAAKEISKKFGRSSDISEADFFAFLIKKQPNITSLICEYRKSLEPEQHTETLFSLGHNLGAREYKVKYSRGNTLNTELTIKRMLQPALNTFLSIETSENELFVYDCPFCNSYSDGKNQECHFIRGYINGFLNATKDEAKVTPLQTVNIHQGGKCCGFSCETH